MKNVAKCLLMAAVVGASGSVFAGGDSGFYLGGSVGNAKADYSEDTDFGDIDFSDEDNAYKIFAGYNFGLVPFLNLAVEGAYVDFGSFEDEVRGLPGKVEADADAFTAAGLVGFDLGPVGLFAKAGLVSWDGDVKALGESDSQSGTDPLYGVGAKIQLGSFAVRAEYEMYDLDELEIDYFSVGASYTF